MISVFPRIFRTGPIQLGVFLAFIETENSDAIFGRLDAAALDQRQHIASAGGVAIRVATSGELDGLASFR